jgi:hypothetical protein
MPMLICFGSINDYSVKKVDSFRDMGPHLPSLSRDRLKEITIVLDEKAQQFSDNCLGSQ